MADTKKKKCSKIKFTEVASHMYSLPRSTIKLIRDLLDHESDEQRQHRLHLSHQRLDDELPRELNKRLTP